MVKERRCDLLPGTLPWFPGKQIAIVSISIRRAGIKLHDDRSVVEYPHYLAHLHACWGTGERCSLPGDAAVCAHLHIVRRRRERHIWYAVLSWADVSGPGQVS